MLDMCRVTGGSHVLHVAGGSGQDALQSAVRVGSGGRVLSTDFSAQLTRLANEQFKNAGIRHASAVEMDGGEELDVKSQSFDAVVSRVGLIFFPDQRGSMKRQVNAIKPGGSVGALVYATPQECRFFSDPVGVIRKHAGLPPPAAGLPGPFSLGAPGVIERLFKDAGLSDVRTQKKLKRRSCLKAQKNAFVLNKKALAHCIKC